MKDEKSIQQRAAPVIGFVGLLIGLLVNTANTIKLDDYNEIVRNVVTCVYMFATFCLIMATVDGVSIYTAWRNDDPEKLLIQLCRWLSGGIACIAIIIPLMIFKKNTTAVVIVLVVFLIALYIVSKYEDISFHESKTDQPHKKNKKQCE